MLRWEIGYGRRDFARFEVFHGGVDSVDTVIEVCLAGGHVGRQKDHSCGSCVACVNAWMRWLGKSMREWIREAFLEILEKV